MSMTNEQREVIEICKEKIIEPFYAFPNPTSIELKDKDVRAIEMVLSMLQEQQEEIERKNKIIEESIKYIDSNNYVDSEECQFQQDFNIKCIGNIDCKDCIKQYFERKVEDETK